MTSKLNMWYGVGNFFSMATTSPLKNLQLECVCGCYEFTNFEHFDTLPNQLNHRIY